MSNTPLSSTDHSKILFFILLMLPPTGFFVGILPAVFLLFGVFMMKKNHDFSHVDTAVRNTKCYIYALIAIAVCGAAWAATTLGAEDRYDRMGEQFILLSATAIVAFVYVLFVDKLFYEPLIEHSEWVLDNGIFSNRTRNTPKKSEIDIIKGEHLRSFSVADELIKWVKLKEDGHVSEQEYDNARKKLLRND
ncbi:SHOCT domain-containing protein [Pseudomonas proteolytica]|uniref:SHOCT domain-containing protein n=1 Tax=Pseudomonas proteolytica TaxID=219574 RepID=UPI0030DBBF22